MEVDILVQLVSEGYTEAIPTDWYITPEHTAMLIGGSVLGGTLFGKWRGKTAEGGVEGVNYKVVEDIDSKIFGEGAALGASVGVTTGFIGQQALPYISKLESLSAYVPEIVKNYDPAFSDLFYFTVPLAFCAGFINHKNKCVDKLIEEEKAAKIEIKAEEENDEFESIDH